VPTGKVNELVSELEGINLYAKVLPFSFKLDETEEKYLPAPVSNDAFSSIVITGDKETSKHANFIFEQVMAESIPNALRENYCKEAGMLLGYPDCCVNKFLSIVNNFEGNTQAFSYVYNNAPGEHSIFLASPFRLIEHLPCSYSCENSIHKAQQTFSLIKDEKRSFRPFVDLFEEIDSLLYLFWSFWQFIGFINPDKKDDVVEYDSFFIFQGPAKKSFSAIKRIADIAKTANAFTIKNGTVEFFNTRSGRTKSSGTFAPDDSRPATPELLSWSRK